MRSILIIKTSSMGDVIHQMPAVTEARRHRPDARIAWLVEEDFAPLVALHPAVDEVMTVASRRWRKSLARLSAWREAAAFVRGLRGRRFDIVVDTQGLARTGLMSKFAQGVRHGYDAVSVRESVATRFYDVRHHVARDLHAIERNRLLTGMALGYVPQGEPDFGLTRRNAGDVPGRYAVFLHGTARREKLWSEDNWTELARAVASRGHSIVLPSGSDAEVERGERIAGAAPQAWVFGRRSFAELTETFAGAAFVVGVDTGLTHLAAAQGVPLVAIFTGTPPELYAPQGPGAIAIVGGKGRAPAVAEVLDAIATVTAREPVAA